jgi:predicted nucleic acid-binding protein
MPVVDASVLVAHLTASEDHHSIGARLREGQLWAPHLVDAEVGHTLRRTVRVGELSDLAARAALDDLRELPLRRAHHGGLLDRAWSLRENVSFYDGLYIALAERLDLPLLTLDARLARAPGLRASVEVIA